MEGRFGSDTINMSSNEYDQIDGPAEEYRSAKQLAILLKQFGFTGAHIRLHVCYSALQNSFGSYLVNELNNWGVPFTSIKGIEGEADWTDMTNEYSYTDIPMLVTS